MRMPWSLARLGTKVPLKNKAALHVNDCYAKGMHRLGNAIAEDIIH